MVEKREWWLAGQTEHGAGKNSWKKLGGGGEGPSKARTASPSFETEKDWPCRDGRDQRSVGERKWSAGRVGRRRPQMTRAPRFDRKSKLRKRMSWELGHLSSWAPERGPRKFVSGHIRSLSLPRCSRHGPRPRGWASRKTRGKKGPREQARMSASWFGSERPMERLSL